MFSQTPLCANGTPNTWVLHTDNQYLSIRGMHQRLVANLLLPIPKIFVLFLTLFFFYHPPQNHRERLLMPLVNLQKWVKMHQYSWQCPKQNPLYTKEVTERTLFSIWCFVFCQRIHLRYPRIFPVEIILHKQFFRREKKNKKT